MKKEKKEKKKEEEEWEEETKKKKEKKKKKSITRSDEDIPSFSFSFSSRWHRSARKGPYALRPVS